MAINEEDKSNNGRKLQQVPMQTIGQQIEFK